MTIFEIAQSLIAVALNERRLKRTATCIGLNEE
jgi:hypothetical protein